MYITFLLLQKDMVIRIGHKDNIAGYIRKVFQRLITWEAMKKLSWSGVKHDEQEKEAFRALYIVQLITSKITMLKIS